MSTELSCPDSFVPAFIPVNAMKLIKRKLVISLSTLPSLNMS
jgi:hypothetical protein